MSRVEVLRRIGEKVREFYAALRMVTLTQFQFCWCYVADAYGGVLDNSQWCQQDKPDSADSYEEPRKNDSEKIEKFRDLIRSLEHDKSSRKNDVEFEMEVTWDPGTNYFVSVLCDYY